MTRDELLKAIDEGRVTYSASYVDEHGKTICVDPLTMRDIFVKRVMARASEVDKIDVREIFNVKQMR